MDFDTDDDGATWTEPSGGTFTADSGDAYYNGGAGWDPLGWRWAPSDTTNFTAIFDGNGHVIENLLVNRGRDYSGLFAALRPGAVVRSLGLPNARVRSGHGRWRRWPARWPAVWLPFGRAVPRPARPTSAPGGNDRFGRDGGGELLDGDSVVRRRRRPLRRRLGGGELGHHRGELRHRRGDRRLPSGDRPGLASGAGAFTASYWDVDRSGIMDDAGTASPEGETSANMRAPTGYTAIYADWDDQDVDGNGTPGETGLPAETGDDDAWDFGERWQWPVLKFGGLDVARQFALQPNEPPTFGSGTVPNKTFRRNMPIAAFQVPAASGGELAITYSATGLPAGLSFGAPNCAARTVCGTPTANTVATVAIHAHDGDTNLEDSDRATLMFTITVVTPTVALTSRPATLTEANLDGAEVTVTLTNTTFASGVTKSSFRLNTTIRGLAVHSLAAVTAGDATATLTLDYNGTDFDAVRALGVTVAASAHTLAGALTTAPVAVAPSLEITATPSSLGLTEAAGAANTGMFTAVLDSAPAANTTVAVTSSDIGAVTVDPATLTFTAQNWSTAQTVTVTAQADDDPNDESPTITLSTAGVGILATVAVKVTDDDRGAVLIDADPATPALDAGPLLLREGASAGYAVRLSAAPSGGNATVAVTSSDAGAVTVDQSSLTFTTRNWNTPQTVTATAVADATDAVDESVIVAHAATGGGYGGAAARLRVAVSDAQRANTDYDTDENGLIEVSTLAQLDAMRWDLDGDGAPTTGDGGAYANAFPQRAVGMGCPAVSGTPTCTGYELTQDLDFDTDGRRVHPRQRRQRLRRHLPQRRRRLGSHRPGLGAERQHPLQRDLRRQRPRHPQPLRQPFAPLRRAVRRHGQRRDGTVAGGGQGLRQRLELQRRVDGRERRAASPRCGPAARCAAARTSAAWSARRPRRRRSWRATRKRRRNVPARTRPTSPAGWRGRTPEPSSPATRPERSPAPARRRTSTDWPAALARRHRATGTARPAATRFRRRAWAAPRRICRRRPRPPASTPAGINWMWTATATRASRRGTSARVRSTPRSAIAAPTRCSSAATTTPTTTA